MGFAALNPSYNSLPFRARPGRRIWVWPSRRSGAKPSASQKGSLPRPALTVTTCAVRIAGSSNLAADRGEQSARIGGKQGLALAIEARFAGRPVGGKRVQHAIAFGVRLRPHGVKAGGQVVGHPLKPESALLSLLTFDLLP